MGFMDEVRKQIETLRQQAQRSQFASRLNAPIQVNRQVAQGFGNLAKATPQNIIRGGVQQQSRVFNAPIQTPKVYQSYQQKVLNPLTKLPTSQYVLGRGQTTADRAIGAVQATKQAFNPNLSTGQRYLSGAQALLSGTGAVLGSTPAGMKVDALLTAPLALTKTAAQAVTGKPMTFGQNVMGNLTGQESLGTSLNPLTRKVFGDQGGDTASMAIDVASMVLGVYKGGKFDPQTKYLRTLDNIPTQFNIPRLGKLDVVNPSRKVNTKFESEYGALTKLKKPIPKELIKTFAKIFDEAKVNGKVNPKLTNQVMEWGSKHLSDKNLSRFTPEQIITELYKHAVGPKVQVYASEVNTPKLSVEPVGERKIVGDIPQTRRADQLVDSYASGEKEAEKIQNILSGGSPKGMPSPSEARQLEAKLAEIETGNRSAVKQLSEEMGVTEYEAIGGLSDYIDFAKRHGTSTKADFYNYFRKADAPSPLGGKVGGEVKQVTPELPKTNYEKINELLGTKKSVGVESVSATPNKTQLSPTPQENVTNPQSNPSDIYYNIDRMNISPEAKVKMKEIINGELKPQIEKATGETLTNAEVIKRAQVANQELVRAIGRDQTEALGAAQLRLRQNIAEMADKGQVTPELLDAIARDKAFSENTARLLQQRTINADPTTPLGKITQQYLQEVLKVNSDLDEVLKASKGVDFNDPKQATAFYRQFVKPSMGEWVDKLRYSSMLSSPNTHINNAFSNFQGTGLLKPIQKTIEGGIDSVISTLTGRKRTRFAGEGGAYAKGYYNSVKTAYKNMMGVLTGKTLSENPDFRSIPLAQGGAKGAADKTMSIIPNALEAMDQFFKTLTRGGLESSAKFRLQKGGTRLSPDSAKEAENLLFRGELVQKGEGVVSNFVGGGAKWVKQATNSKVPAFRWLAKLTLPFVNTGTNLAKAGLEANPVTGLINMIGNEDKIAAAAKMVMGGTVMALVTPLAMDGRMTYAEPRDQKNKNAFRAAGMKPYSIKIGDKWVSYQKLHPLLAFQMATVAGITDAYEKGKITEDQGSVIAEGLFNGLRFFADQTYFKNIGDLSSSLDGDVEGLGRFVSNYPTQFIPFRAGMSWLNRIIDKYQRQPDTTAGFFTQQMQQIASQLPLASFAVPKRLDSQGQPIENKNRFLNALSPMVISTENEKKKKIYDYYTNALRSYKNIQKLSAEEKTKMYSSIKAVNPSLYSQIIKIAKDEKMGTTSQEAKIRSKPVDERARSVAAILNKAKTKEERNKLYGEMVRKGIITKEVAKQLPKLLKKY